MVGSRKVGAILVNSMIYAFLIILAVIYTVKRIASHDIERYEHDATPESVRRYIRQMDDCNNFKHSSLK